MITSGEDGRAVVAPAATIAVSLFHQGQTKFTREAVSLSIKNSRASITFINEIQPITYELMHGDLITVLVL